MGAGEGTGVGDMPHIICDEAWIPGIDAEALQQPRDICTGAGEGEGAGEDAGTGTGKVMGDEAWIKETHPVVDAKALQKPRGTCMGTGAGAGTGTGAGTGRFSTTVKVEVGCR